MKKVSGPAIFMYSVIALCLCVAGVCFCLYYGGKTANRAALWTGIVSFMIVYHFWLRIIMGNVTKLFNINRDGHWFRERKFERKLYEFLRVKKWKGKALTYNPDAFSLDKNSLEEIADTTAKSELDHWVNEIISIGSIFFSLLWGEFWIFFATAILAMIFDAQFIIIQRYNRPRLLKIIQKKQRAKQLS